MPPRPFKIVLLGDSAVGKTHVMHRVCTGNFVEGLPATIGIDRRALEMHVDGTAVKLVILDTAGQECFRSAASRLPFLQPDAAVVVCDTTQRHSFESIPFHIRSINNKHTCVGDVHIMIMCTKCDEVSRREVSTEEARALADSWGATYIEVSAKTGFNVEEAFMELARTCLDRHPVEGLDFVVTISAILENNSAKLACTNLSGEELNSIEVFGTDSKTWAEICPELLPSAILKGRQPKFILPDGSLANASHDSKTVSEVLQLTSLGVSTAGGCVLVKMLQCVFGERVSAGRRCRLFQHRQTNN